MRRILLSSLAALFATGCVVHTREYVAGEPVPPPPPS